MKNSTILKNIKKKNKVNMKSSKKKNLLKSKKLIFLLKCPVMKLFEDRKIWYWDIVINSFIKEFKKHNIVLGKTYYLYPITNDGLAVEGDTMSFKLNSFEYDEIAKLFLCFDLPISIEAFVDKPSGYIFLGVSEY